MNETTRHEYIVESPGRGYVTGMNWNLVPELPIVDDPRRLSFNSQAQAESYADELRESYIRLGAPEIAKQVRVLRRTVTETRTEFEPLVSIRNFAGKSVRVVP